MQNNFVYWIHKKEHTNLLLEGYIGITADTGKRWNEHKRLKGGCTHLYNAIQKYGAENLVWETIFTGTRAECIEKEISYRPTCNIGWNIIPGGQISTGMKGKKHSNETKIKIGNSNRGKLKSDETRKKISNAKKGKPLSESHKQLLRKIHKGKIPAVPINEQVANYIKKHGKHPSSIPVICVETGKVFDSAKTASIELQINHSNIIQVCKGRRKTAGKFTWKYKT